MLTKCSECGGEVSSEALSCPHCGIPRHAAKAAFPPAGGSAPAAPRPVYAQPHPAPPQKSSSGCGCLAGVGGLLSVLVLCVLVCGGVLMGLYNMAQQNQTLVDETKVAQTGQYWVEQIKIYKPCKLEALIQVTSGPAVNCYLMDPAQKQEYVTAVNTPGGATFHYTPKISRKDTTGYTDTADIAPGDWFLIVTPVDGAPAGQSSTIHIRLVVKPPAP